MRQPNEFTPLVRRSGAYAGLFETFQGWPEGEYNPSWQPPDDYASGPDGPVLLFAVHADYPDDLGSGWQWTETHDWERAVADPSGPGGWRPLTDAERLAHAKTTRLAQFEAAFAPWWDGRYASYVLPAALSGSMTPPGFGNSIKAEFVAAMGAVNSATDAVLSDATDTPAKVAEISIAWPTNPPITRDPTTWTME